LFDFTGVAGTAGLASVQKLRWEGPRVRATSLDSISAPQENSILGWMESFEESFPARYDSLHPKSSTRAKVVMVVFGLLSLLVIIGVSIYAVSISHLPEGFVYLDTVNPDIEQDIRLGKQGS
jgi:hypothetical protein